MLTEDPNERAAFDATVKNIYKGDPLLAIQSWLTTWSRSSPQGGSFAKVTAIFANELDKARANRNPHNETPVAREGEDGRC